VAPLNAPGATLSTAGATELHPVDSYPRNSLEVGYKTQYTPQQMSGAPSMAPPPPPLRSGGYQPDFMASEASSVTPPAMPPLRNRTTYVAFVVTLLVVLVVAVSIGTFALLNHNSNNPSSPPTTQNNNGQDTTTGGGAPPPIITGQVGFNDSQDGQGMSNTLTIKATGLNAPPAGSQYHAWLIDATNEEKVTSLGVLANQAQGYALTFKGGPTNLLSVGNKITITQEQGDPPIPIGTPVLTGTFPPLAFVHIKHLLFSFSTTPQQKGLLVGLLDQAQKLNTAALLLKNANGNRTVVRCAAQSIINIAEGVQGAQYQPLPAGCAKANITEVGDGLGLIGDGHYIKLALAHAALAANSADATQTIKIHASHVAIATKENLLPWITTIVQDAQALLNDPDDNDKILEIATLADHAYNGVDLNHNEQVDPVKGEAGAKAAYNHGQLMALLPLSPAQ